MKRSFLIAIGKACILTSAIILVACAQLPNAAELPPTGSETESPSGKEGNLLPAKADIDVPFSSQAPFANWNAPYQEACEEMSLIMVHYFLEKKVLTPEIADKELRDLIKWEKENGYAEDVTITQLAEIACKYYDHCSNKLINDVTSEQIKSEISKGRPVIAPMAGRDLGNPYYSGEGPWYHMLVIRGYTKNKFITNDPGTRRGKGYKYAYSAIINAIHDWTGVKEEIRKGGKIMLVIEP